MENKPNRPAPERPATHRRHDLQPVITWSAGTLILILVIVNSLGGNGSGQSSTHALGTSPDFVLNDLSDSPVHLADYRGHPVLVNVWASWCPPCRAEFPELIEYYRSHVLEGLVLLTVNSSDQLESARRFATQSQLPFPVLFDPDGTMQRDWGVDGLPTTFLLDRGGTVRFQRTGQLTRAVLDEQVTPLWSQ